MVGVWDAEEDSGDNGGHAVSECGDDWVWPHDLRPPWLGAGCPPHHALAGPATQRTWRLHEHTGEMFGAYYLD